MDEKCRRGLLVVAAVTVMLATVILSMPAGAAELWSGDITINANGTVTPSDAPVKVNNGQYKLTKDVAGFITIYASNITFKGDGHGLIGSGSGTGVASYGVSNVIIKDLVVSGYGTGIYFYMPESNTIKDCEVYNNNKGIFFLYGNLNVIKGCKAHDNAFGIHILRSEGNEVKGNFIHDNAQYGVMAQESNNNVYKGNEVYDNAGIGVYLYLCNYDQLTGNFIHDTGNHGLFLNGSSYTLIEENEICGGGNIGVFLSGSPYDQAIRNYVHDNVDRGVYLYNSDSYLIEGNEISFNLAGTITYLSDYGIQEANYIHDNTNQGIQVSSGTFNDIYYNNIIDNGNPQASASGSDNVWDNGAGVGNFWSDYDGSDTDDDGIGDTDLPHLGLDYYPSMSPF